MPLHYFIDGYNLIWSADNFGGGKLQTQRERLLRFLEAARPAGSAKNAVTVIFDGQEDVDSPPWRGAVKVIFSKGEEADAVIKRSVDTMSAPRSAVVVTDDRDIQRWVKASKAKVLTCKEFFREVSRKNAPGKGGAKPDSRGIDPSDAAEINEEFRRIFLP